MKRLALATLVPLGVLAFTGSVFSESSPRAVAQNTASSSKTQAMTPQVTDQQPVQKASAGVTTMPMTEISNAALNTEVYASTQQDQENGSPEPDLPPLLQELIAAIDARDGAALSSIYADDGTHEDVAAAVLANGRAEIQAYVEGVWSQFPDFQFEPISGRQAGEIAWLEYQFSGTDPESGRSFASSGVIIIELERGLVRRSADYSDFTNALVQIGQLVPVDEAAEATPGP
jgi:ketosteroid isomerase-like protein